MPGDLLRLLNCPAIFKVCGNSGRTKRVTASMDVNASRGRAPLDHSQRIRSVHPISRDQPITAERSKQGCFFLIGDACGINVGVDVHLG